MKDFGHIISGPKLDVNLRDQALGAMTPQERHAQACLLHIEL